MSLKDPDLTPRNELGNKARMDGQGDGWANQHRESLPQSHGMLDIDYICGMAIFGQETSDRLFLEYKPDEFSKNRCTVRRFGVAAVFDRKASEADAFDGKSTLSLAFYLDLCRVYGERQEVPPKFFYLIGGRNPPWRMIGIDINTGKPNGANAVLGCEDWTHVWKELGIDDVREAIRKWLFPPQIHWKERLRQKQRLTS